MAANSSIHKSCDLVLASVRSSSLNYSSQETPFSIYLITRKSFSKANFNHSPGGDSNHQNLNQDILVETLKSNIKALEDKNLHLVHSYEEAVSDSEESYRKVKELEVILKGFEQKVIETDNSDIQKKDKTIESLKYDKMKLEKTEFLVNLKASPSLNFDCNICDVKTESLVGLKTHYMLVHTKVSSTQKIKFVQSCSDSVVCEKPIQTIKDAPEETVVKEELEFKKYPCFYCAINIAGEYHLSDHRIKCRGTMLMGVTPGLPRPPMPPMLFRNYPQTYIIRLNNNKQIYKG